MKDKNKKRDPMPPPDATPEEIGEFWDTHSLADYWDETHEVEVQVNLKPSESAEADQNDTFSTEQGWQKLKELIQSIKPTEFEKLAAALLTSFFQVPFVVARSGDQPSGDARDLEGKIPIQAKRYTTTRLDESSIVGEIYRARDALPNLQVYVLALSRDRAQSHDRFDRVEEDTGLDIVVLELTDKLSDLGALCVTFWEDIYHFFSPSDIDQEFSDWVQIARNDSKTHKKMKDVRSKLKEGIHTQKHVQKDVEKYLLGRFSTDTGFNPIDLSQTIDRKSIESQISNWWESPAAPICYLEGKEGHGKSWLAAKWINTICDKENIVTFWLDSNEWEGHKSIFDLLYTCFDVIYLSYKQEKIAKLQNKAARIWHNTLIVLDGVNEWNAIKTAQRMLAEYFRHDENEWRDRIRFLLTTRPLNDYPDFESNWWSRCHKISVDPFNDLELQKALNCEGLQLNDLPNSLKDIARIPRYFQTCIRLREQFRSFDAVTKEMVLWKDLLDKIERTDPQIKQRLGWYRAKDAQKILAYLAKQTKWSDLNAPHASIELLEKSFPNYREVRHDLEEQNIAIEAGPLHAKLSANHIVLGWALYLSNLFDCTEFNDIEGLFEHFQQELEPIPSEDLRTKALFVALQITAISPDPDIPQDQLSQKRAALILACFRSHNLQIPDEQLSFWVEKDTDAYAQIVEFEFRHRNSLNDEEKLLKRLAKIWLKEEGQIDRLAERLKKWLLPTHSVNSPENRVYTDFEGDRFPVRQYDPQVQLSAAAVSILSQRPDPEFLETLARCYETLERYGSPDKNIGILMRWRYTEKVLDNLYLLAKQSPTDTRLLKGFCGLIDYFRVGLPPDLKSALSKEDKKKSAFVQQYNPICNRFINPIRKQERLLTGDSPEVNANHSYYELDHLAVRKDLPPLCDEDQNEIKKISYRISVSPEKGISKNLIPWAARCDPESYAELACNLKINALNQKLAQIELSSIQGLIFKSEDCERITEAILGMKPSLAQDEDFYSDVEWLTSLLTEALLFSASEEQLTNWFEFLASHGPLRNTIALLPIPNLLEQLLPESIVKLAQQKLETLRFTLPNGQNLPIAEVKECSEEEFWCMLYAYSVQRDENTVKYVLEDLKMREPASTGTFPMLRLALSDPKRFLDEMLIDERIQSHLFSDNGRRFILRIYNKDENFPSYEVLRGYLPPEFVGSFLCSPDRRGDLSRWGRDFMAHMCSILQDDETNHNSVENMRFTVNPEALKIWAEQNTTNFLQLANKYFTELSKSQWSDQGFSDFTDAVRCLLLRFQPDEAIKYYRRWKIQRFKTVISRQYGIETFLDQLWRVEDCNLPEHRDFRRELLEECLNDEEIMFMTLAALAGGGEEELWNLVTEEYLASPYAKERNLAVSILPWFGNDKAIKKLEQLKSEDPSQWVREHAAWAYEVAQQERSCREVYRGALQTRDLFRISAVFEQIKPALLPTARWWHEIEHAEFREKSQNIDSRLAALVDRFWYRWGNSSNTKRNIEVFRRRLSEHCRGEKISAFTPRIAPWWKPSSEIL